MDDKRFDRLTRRIVLSGAAAGALGVAFDWDASEAKGCKRHHKPCGSGCCPKGSRCENGACVKSCKGKFSCDHPSGDARVCGKDCGCTQNLAGRSSCAFKEPGVKECTDLTACVSNADCPNGRFCALCTCAGGTADFRCILPCSGK